MKIEIRDHEPLAPRTTLEVGGAARFYAEPKSADEVRECLAWADAQATTVQVIGRGSNLLVADAGIDALVLRQRARAITAIDDVTVDVDAGVDWDAFVAWCVERSLAGVECLSGIPGDVGAAPIQNIGAYGQELSETLLHVEAIDRTSGAAVTLSHADCELAYRDSVFKHTALNRYVIHRVRFRLIAGGPPKIAYAELERAIGDEQPSLARVRDMIIALRRKKSMVLDPEDENRRSAGSFFVNPAVPNREVPTVRERAREVAPGERMPAFPVQGGKTKLSAAWMIERSGLVRGTTRGAAGISTNHSLALINCGGASASELIELAIEVKQAVVDTFGVSLQPEPRLLGFHPPELEELLAVSEVAPDSW